MATPQNKIRIRLKAYDSSAIETAAKEIVDTAQRTGATVAHVAGRADDLRSRRLGRFPSINQKQWITAHKERKVKKRVKRRGKDETRKGPVLEKVRGDGTSRSRKTGAERGGQRMRETVSHPGREKGR